MSYSSTVTATKPAGVVWFNKANKEVSQAELTWTKSQPGFVSLTVTTPDATTLVSTLVFQDQASFEAMAAARATRLDYQARKAYHAANNITRTVTRS
jgi:hypothetical protein